MEHVRVRHHEARRVARVETLRLGRVPVEDAQGERVRRASNAVFPVGARVVFSRVSGASPVRLRPLEHPPQGVELVPRERFRREQVDRARVRVGEEPLERRRVIHRGFPRRRPRRDDDVRPGERRLDPRALVRVQPPRVHPRAQKRGASHRGQRLIPNPRERPSVRDATGARRNLDASGHAPPEPADVRQRVGAHGEVREKPRRVQGGARTTPRPPGRGRGGGRRSAAGDAGDSAGAVRVGVGGGRAQARGRARSRSRRRGGAAFALGGGEREVRVETGGGGFGCFPFVFLPFARPFGSPAAAVFFAPRVVRGGFVGFLARAGTVVPRARREGSELGAERRRSPSREPARARPPSRARRPSGLRTPRGVRTTPRGLLLLPPGVARRVFVNVVLG